MLSLGLRWMSLMFAAGLLVSCNHFTVSADEVRGSDLRAIIENQIRDHVRESYGEFAGQNFSDDDLERFNKENVTQQVVGVLRNSKVFLAAVDRVRALSPDDRASYLRRCRQPLRKTWAELGEISPKGTTEAGQKAEIALANAITNLAESLLNNSVPPKK
jgi:hypothetical protein